MSAIGGIYSRRGAPIEASSVARLSAGLQQLGPDGEKVLVRPYLAMIHRPFHVDARSRREEQPWVSPGGIVVTWNGRLDNGSQVRNGLGQKPSDGATAPQLVAALYERYGVEGFRRLIGDFCLALWDPQLRRMVLATDAFGLRPLFFYSDHQRLIWSSRARATLDASGRAPALDEVGVAAFLTFIDAGSHTALEGIQMLPAAHALTVDRDHLRLERYWSPVPKKAIRYASDQEYEEHFRHLFRQAVADRMVAGGPVWSDLSGGLDSSSIVCVGDNILQQRGGDLDDLRTISCVYDESRSCDERSFIQTVEEQRGRQGLHLRDEDHPVMAPVPPGISLDLPSGQLPFHRRYGALAQEMEASGSRVLLRGSGGDHVFWGEAPAAFELADRLAEGRLGALWTSARRWARTFKEPVAKTLWRGAVWPFLPHRLRRSTSFLNTLDAWFDPRFVRRVALADRLVGRKVKGFPSPSQRIHWSLMEGVGRYVGWELPLEQGAIEARFPFLDRRLVEFSLAIPTEQMLRPGETRSVLRRALRGVLPEAVRVRSSKAGADEAIYRALVREANWISNLFGSDARVVRHGFVQPEQLQRALATARHGVPLNTAQLMRVLSLETWLRSLENSPATKAETLPIHSSRPVGMVGEPWDAVVARGELQPF